MIIILSEQDDDDVELEKKENKIRKREIVIKIPYLYR